MTSAYPDIEGQLYTSGTPDGTYTEAEARQRAASHREVKGLVGTEVAAAVAPFQSQVSALSFRVDKTLTDAKAYTDAQLAEFDSFVGVPIFETLAEAEAWEAANPGKRALTLEPSTPDTTAPVWNATLSVGTPTDKQVAVTASTLATDDRAVAGYEVTYNGTTWAGITPTGKSFTLTGSPATTYSSTRLRAKDAAGNVSTALPVPSYTMAATPPAPPTFDTFSKDGTLIGRLAESGDASWVESSAEVWSSTLASGNEPLAAQGGAAVGPGRAVIDRKATNGTLKATFSVTGSTALRLGAALAPTKSVDGGNVAAVVLKITPGQISLDVTNSGGPILETKASQDGAFTSGEATLTVNGKQVTATVAGTTISYTLGGDPVGTLWGLWLYSGATVDRFEVTA